MIFKSFQENIYFNKVNLLVFYYNHFTFEQFGTVFVWKQIINNIICNLFDSLIIIFFIIPIWNNLEVLIIIYYNQFTNISIEKMELQAMGHIRRNCWLFQALLHHNLTNWNCFNWKDRTGGNGAHSTNVQQIVDFSKLFFIIVAKNTILSLI